ncbi:MAG: hypothetical protein QNJ60_17890 [Xenococcaceae cyanobacterium MO_188.B19]|nr:hypothetical protein [Xenococcaceae cyanobacterium MO_188.B19]
MNKVQCEAKKKPDFSSLKDDHEKLYEQVSEIVLHKEISGTKEEKDEWSKKIQAVSDQIVTLIKYIATFASQVTSIDEYNWVREAAYEWGAVEDCLELTSPLFYIKEVGKKSENIRQTILSLLPKELPEFSLMPKISKEDLQKEAYYLAGFRKERLIIENPSRIHQLIPSSREEILADWYSACTYFSSKILEGKLDLPTLVKSELYDCLEKVWLEDVKQLKAYQIWRSIEDRWISENHIREDYYYQACNQIADSLVDPYIKAPPSRFEALQDYLKNHYLTDEGKLDENKSHNLIERKAYRIWKKTKNSNSWENWSSAKQYVEDLYGNIIPAVLKSDPKSITRVKNAIKASENPAYYNIINCFEMALVIYFLPSEVFQDVEEI